MRSLRSPHIRRKRNIRIFAKVLIGITICTIVVGLPVFVARLESLQIKEVTVTGATSISSAEIVDATQKILDESYVYVIPKTNIFMYPQNTIEHVLKDQFPRIETIDVRAGMKRKIEIKITERSAVAQWCKTDNLDTCYFMDSQGYIFAQSPTFTDAVYMVYRGDTKEIPIGSSYLTVEQFTQIQGVLVRLNTLGIKPISVTYIENNEFEIMISGGGSVRMSLRDNVDKNISNLESILSDTKAGILVEEKLTVQSIDLRYGNKIIIQKKVE